MEYTIQVTVRVCADSEREAYSIINHALEHAKKAEIIHLDSEILETKEEEDYSEDEMRASPLWKELRKQ